VAGDPLLDVPVALPVDDGLEVALLDHALDDGERAIVVRPVAAVRTAGAENKADQQWSSSLKPNET
jgi:hypothetical protein